MGHHLLLITTEIQENTSLQARQRVYEQLCGFLEHHEPSSDYATIGGAWSGYLIGKEFPSDQELGEDHDALALTHELYLQHLAEFRGKKAHHGDTLMYLDLEEETCFGLFIGRKWIVVCDMHF